MASLKQPPVFDPDGGDSYVNWKNDLEVWCLFTKEEKKRQGPAIYLSLKGDARETVRDISRNELSQDGGVKMILDLLDKVYLKGTTIRAFCALKVFIEFRRQGGMSFSRFLVEFNEMYREVKNFIWK